MFDGPYFVGMDLSLGLPATHGNAADTAVVRKALFLLPISPSLFLSYYISAVNLTLDIRSKAIKRNLSALRGLMV